MKTQKAEASHVPYKLHIGLPHPMLCNEPLLMQPFIQCLKKAFGTESPEAATSVRCCTLSRWPTTLWVSSHWALRFTSPSSAKMWRNSSHRIFSILWGVITVRLRHQYEIAKRRIPQEFFGVTGSCRNHSLVHVELCKIAVTSERSIRREFF